jgi:outer membrane lipoprotein-sorting protein
MSDLGDALELLHGAAGRVKTLTATLLVWYDEQRGSNALEAAQQRADGDSVAVLSAGKGESPQLRRYELRTLVHYRHPDRYRLHRQANADARLPHDVLQVWDGQREWMYVAALREAWVHAPGHHELRRLLDPSWLVAACTLSVAGRGLYEGRPAVELDGRPRRDPVDPLDPPREWGADGLQVVLDAGTGLLLSLTSRFQGEPYKVERLTGVIVNQSLDDELFRFTPPEGVRVDDSVARPLRRPPLRFRLGVLRQRLGRRSRVYRRW